MKLTADLIADSPQFFNANKDWELDLRGNKIPVLENLGCTLDQFDVIDFSDNDIRKLEGFPVLRRLKTLFFNNNRIIRISEGLEQLLPNLRELMLTNNALQELGDLDPLSTIKTLTHMRPAPSHNTQMVSCCTVSSGVCWSVAWACPLSFLSVCLSVYLSVRLGEKG
jgi:U2 small nuclear ribonucleoprotein A'